MQMALGYLVENPTASTLRREQTAVFHLAEMLRGHVTGDAAGLRRGGLSPHRVQRHGRQSGRKHV